MNWTGEQDGGMEDLKGVFSSGSRRGIAELDPEIRQKVYTGNGDYAGMEPQGDFEELHEDVRNHLYDRGYDSSRAGEIVDDVLESSEEPVNGEDIKRVLRERRDELERQVG